MSDRTEDRQPAAAAAVSSGSAAAALPARSNDAAAAAPAVAGGTGVSQAPNEYVVIHLRLQHLRVLLFVLITVLSVGGAVYGYFQLPLLFAPLPLPNVVSLTRPQRGAPRLPWLQRHARRAIDPQ